MTFILKSLPRMTLSSLNSYVNVSPTHWPKTKAPNSYSFFSLGVFLHGDLPVNGHSISGDVCSSVQQLQHQTVKPQSSGQVSGDFSGLRRRRPHEFLRLPFPLLHPLFLVCPTSSCSMASCSHPSWPPRRPGFVVVPEVSRFVPGKPAIFSKTPMPQSCYCCLAKFPAVSVTILASLMPLPYPTATLFSLAGLLHSSPSASTTPLHLVLRHSSRPGRLRWSSNPAQHL